MQQHPLLRHVLSSMLDKSSVQYSDTEFLDWVVMCRRECRTPPPTGFFQHKPAASLTEHYLLSKMESRWKCTRTRNPNTAPICTTKAYEHGPARPGFLITTSQLKRPVCLTPNPYGTPFCASANPAFGTARKDSDRSNECQRDWRWRHSDFVTALAFLPCAYFRRELMIKALTG